MELARETFAVAEVEDVVELVHADVRAGLEDVDGVSFAFLDSEKEDYLELYELVVPKLVPGGLLVADNVTDFHDEVTADARPRSGRRARRRGRGAVPDGPAPRPQEVVMATVEELWAAFLEARPDLAGPETPPAAWHFCDNQADADELAGARARRAQAGHGRRPLVLRGRGRAAPAARRLQHRHGLGRRRGLRRSARPPSRSSPSTR